MDRALLKTLFLSIALILLTLLIYPYFKDSSRGPIAEWHMINVNLDGQQGDANLIVIGEQTVMIDAGKKRIAYGSVVPYLQKFGINRIDHFFISHPDDAYYGGLVSILDSGIKVAKVYHSRNAVNSIQTQQELHWYLLSLEYAKGLGAEIIEVEKGFILQVPSDGRFEVIHSGPELPTGSGDPTIGGTLVLKFEVAGSSVLFTANAGRQIAEELEGSSKVQAEFLKMPHPGGGDPAPKSMFDQIDPEFALVPGPKRRWCDEPGRIAREWTVKTRLPTWVTGSNGHIRVIWRPGHVLITPQRVDARCKLRAFGSVQVRR